MFKKVQYKFIVSTMCIMLAILIIILGSINIVMSTLVQRKSMDMLNKIASDIEYSDNKFVFPSFPSPNIPLEPHKQNRSEKINNEFNIQNSLALKRPDIFPQTVGATNYFIVMTDFDGNFIDTYNCEDTDSDLIQSYVKSILKDDSKNGMIDTLQYFISKKDNGVILVFTDKSSELDMLDQLVSITFIIGAISFVALSIVVVFLSRKNMESVEMAFEKQKQFISDASHELKTPLAIISTNTDVLMGEIGNNKWLAYIKSQTERMSFLVTDLLNLSRLENKSNDIIFADFDLSNAVLNSVLPFECRAFESQKELLLDVQKNIHINASERHIKQLITIFVDNALKHSNEKGKVIVSLLKQNGKIFLSIYNTGSKIRDDEKDKIFERFYRSDDSRSRMTGGYGLGLAIAKSIIDYHKFKLTVENSEGKYIKFIISMKLGEHSD